MKKQSVLIVCTGNSARSQMVEGLIRHEAGDVFEVSSAGTNPAPVRAEAVAVMAELGIDISGQHSKPIREFEGQTFDFVITVCDKAREECDVSQTAIDATKQRLGRAAEHIHWMQGDITQVSLPPHSFDVWHDRAVFHFLTDVTQREAYVRSVLNGVRPGGHVIVSTFGPEGPTKCSGLDVVRYDVDALHREFGRQFRIEESAKEVHRTPWGATQQFVYCCCRIE